MPFLLIKKFKDSHNLRCVLSKYFMLLEILFFFFNFLLIFSFKYKILASLLSNTYEASLVTQDSKESACNAGDSGLIPGSGRSSGEGNGYPLQYSCLGNSMDRGAWRATVYGVAKHQT